MTDELERQELPEARLTPGRRVHVSVIWIIPVLAAVVAVGIAVNRVMKEGPTITIEFRSADGIEAGKTFIKYKDVKIGQVTAVELSDDFTKVEVTARIAKNAEGLIVEDARFWVVEPRISLSGVSGLGTLLSGNYIGFAEGRSKKSERKFVGLENAPVVSDLPGREFVLTAKALGSLGVGSPVYFRRIQVGEVTSYELSQDGNSITFRLFVGAPYDRFVNPETRFWNASGIDVSVGANGLEVRTESLVSLLAGGVSFETPPFAKPEGPASAGTQFQLFDDRRTAMRQPESISRHYVLYFDESLRGVSVGAPVALLGLPAGEVTDVSLELDPKQGRPRGRVEIVAYPERIVRRLSGKTAEASREMLASNVNRHAFFERLVERQGLRAQLRSGNIVTGERYVALDFFPDAQRASVDWSLDAPLIPTVSSTLPELQAKLESILAKIDSIPFQKVGDDLAKTLESANRMLADIDTGVAPELKATLAELRKTLATADRVLKGADQNITSPDAPTLHALQQALDEVAGAARALRSLADYLERHPEALIQGKPQE
ncbi:MAG: MlaD family protein [Steroidobacteraceae bacterium]